MKKIIKLFVLFLIFILSACNHSESTDNYIETVNFNPEQVIEYFNNSLSGEYNGNPYTVLSNEMKTVTFYYEDLEKTEIVSCKKVAVEKIPSTVPDLKYINAYEVNSIKEFPAMSVEVCAIYFVGRNSESEPWLIYGIEDVNSQTL